MTDSANFVISTPLTAFVGTFQNFAYILRPSEVAHWSLMQKKNLFYKMVGLWQLHLINDSSIYFVKSTPLRAFVGSFQNLNIHYRHIEDVHVKL